MGEPELMTAADAPVDPSGRLQEAVAAARRTVCWVISLKPPASKDWVRAGSESIQTNVMAPAFAEPATPKSASISFASGRNSE